MSATPEWMRAVANDAADRLDVHSRRDDDWVAWEYGRMHLRLITPVSLESAVMAELMAGEAKRKRRAKRILAALVVVLVAVVAVT